MKVEDLNNILALGEGFTTEFKRSGTSNLGREICAFANATGGLILLGVNDLREIVGVNNHNRPRSEVQAIARPDEPPRVRSTLPPGPEVLQMRSTLPHRKTGADSMTSICLNDNDG